MAAIDQQRSFTVPKMSSSCTRCCLHKSIRIVNLITNLLAICMIIYSLWLQKKWNDGVYDLPTKTNLPKPWFITTCLGVGIAVCLSTLFGHMVANCITNSTLCTYIVTICSLLLLEVAVIVSIFFRIDWKKDIVNYIDEGHAKFKSFVIFHLKMCQFIAIIILVPQINVIVLAIILWVVGTQPRTFRSDPEISSVIQSFLVRPTSPTSNGTSTQTCNGCDTLLAESTTPYQSIWSHIKSLFRIPFRTTTVC